MYRKAGVFATGYDKLNARKASPLHLARKFINISCILLSDRDILVRMNTFCLSLFISTFILTVMYVDISKTTTFHSAGW